MRAVENDFDGTRMTIPRARDATGQGGDGGAFVRVHAGHGQATFCAGAHRTWSGPLHQRAGAAHAKDANGQWSRRCDQSINLLLFLQKQNLATAIYLFGLGTLLTGLGLKHMRIRSHHDLAGALVTSLLLGRPWWSTTSPTCLPLSVFTITSDQHRCRIPPLL